MKARIDAARQRLILAIADDELVTGHRSSHWTGVAPTLEEDLAFSTIAQDEINHADVWYRLVVGTGDEDEIRAGVDALGLGRDPDQYLHAVICERPPTDFAFSLARHWLYDHADAIRLESLEASSDPAIAAVARKLRFEERYHLEHADHWIDRLTRGGPQASRALEAGLAAALPEAPWLFEPVADEPLLVEERILPEPSSLLIERWRQLIDGELSGVGVDQRVPDVTLDPPGGRAGVHTADFTEDVWPEMTELYQRHPEALW